MSGEPARFSVQRLVVATDQAGSQATTFSRAAALAARLGAELTVLLVEDERLLQAAALPLSRYVSPHAAPADLAVGAIETELRALAARTRTAVADAAGRAGIAWTFAILRGDPAEEIGRATGPGDLVVFGPEADFAGHALRFGRSLRGAAVRVTASILMTRGRPALARPLAVAQLDSPFVERVLAAAARLSMPERPEIDVLSIGNSADQLERFDRMIRDLLADRGVRARVQHADAVSVRRLAQTASAVGSDLLVLASDAALLSGDGTETLLASLGCEILVVR